MVKHFRAIFVTVGLLVIFRNSTEDSGFEKSQDQNVPREQFLVL